jgi:predicted transcriptional regulator
MKIKRFTDEDIKFLEENYMTMTHAEMAEKLGRTKGTISTKLSQLGLIKRPETPWTEY